MKRRFKIPQSIVSDIKYYVGANINNIDTLAGVLQAAYYRYQIFEFSLISVFFPATALLPGLYRGAYLAQEVIPTNPTAGWLAYVCERVYLPFTLAYILIFQQVLTLGISQFFLFLYFFPTHNTLGGAIILYSGSRHVLYCSDGSCVLGGW